MRFLVNQKQFHIVTNTIAVTSRLKVINEIQLPLFHLLDISYLLQTGLCMLSHLLQTQLCSAHPQVSGGGPHQSAPEDLPQTELGVAPELRPGHDCGPVYGGDGGEVVRQEVCQHESHIKIQGFVCKTLQSDPDESHPPVIH